MANPTPGTPVPPDELIDAWSDDYPPPQWNEHREIADKAASWGYTQAIPERAELIRLLTDSANVAESYAAQSSPSYGTVALDQHAKKCRAAAERLGGGEQ